MYCSSIIVVPVVSASSKANARTSKARRFPWGVLPLVVNPCFQCGQHPNNAVGNHYSTQPVDNLGLTLWITCLRFGKD